jgi:diguanylate cyclase
VRKEEYEIEEIIRIVLNNENKVLYSSININETHYYLKKLGALNKLSKVSCVQYCLENHLAFIDEFYINDQKYHMITIVSSKQKCSDCSKCSKVLVDSVTGLHNRNYWELINNGSIYYPLSTKDFALIIIDIDNLKEINDNFGHLAGDEVIKIVGQSIKRNIRKEDLGVRYGGDEFLILLFNQDKRAAKKVIERIRKEINELTASQRMSIQISAGVAYYNSLRNVGDIIKMADRDLYKEKRVKKSKEKQNSEKLKHLLREIEKLRDELNKKVTLEGKGINNEETLKLSQKLDELITRYLIDE